MFQVIVVGGATVDTFLDTNVHEHRRKLIHEMCYPVGAKLSIKNADIFTGGGGSNTAVAFSRLGLKTGYLGKLGNDNNSKLILDELKREKINFLGSLDKDKTDFSIILDSYSDRTILNYKGASKNLRFNDLKLGKLKTKWMYFSTVLGESLNTQKKLARFAKKNNIKLGFNTSYYLAEKGTKFLKDILDATTVLVLNKEEAELLAGKNNIEGMLKKLRDVGPRIVCITDGENGSYCYDGNYLYYQKPHKIKVVERTGAGDAYASTLVAGIIKKNNIEKAMKYALENAESVIQHKGAKNILLSWSKIIMNSNKHTNTLIKKRLK